MFKSWNISLEGICFPVNLFEHEEMFEIISYTCMPSTNDTIVEKNYIPALSWPLVIFQYIGITSI